MEDQRKSVRKMQDYIKEHIQEDISVHSERNLGTTQKSIPMYVVSNSGFSVEALRIVLDRYGIGKYFRSLWSSADFGRIKPCKEFFELAIQTALSDNPLENKENIIYVGDLYETDVIGARNAEIQVAWINKKGEEDEAGLATFAVTTVLLTIGWEKLSFNLLR